MDTDIHFRSGKRQISCFRKRIQFRAFRRGTARPNHTVAALGQENRCSFA